MKKSVAVQHSARLKLFAQDLPDPFIWRGRVLICAYPNTSNNIVALGVDLHFHCELVR